MKRMHLFEWEDQAWFPSTIRDFMTDYLRQVVSLFGLYKPVVPILEKMLANSENKKIIDLASGGGGPWISLAPVLRKTEPNLKVVLTDLYPNIKALEFVQNAVPDAIDINKEPVNALNVPKEYEGIRTQFLSLHHFSPEQVKAIFQNAIELRQPIATFEFQERSISQIIQFMFAPIGVLILTIFTRPFSWKRLLFTYIIPLIPLFTMWDGIVSALRTYTPEETQEIIESIPNWDSYSWDIGVIKEGPVTVTYATGQPKE